MKLNIVLHYWVGLIGMHLLLRRGVGLSFPPLVIYLASVFTFCGALVLHIAVGHSVFLPAFYLPFLLFFWIHAVKTASWRAALAGGAVVATIIYNGGLNIVPMAIVVVAGCAIVTAAIRRRSEPILLAIAIGASAACFAGPKLIPTMLFVESKQFRDTRGVGARPDWLTVETLVREYVDPYGSTPGPGWYEYGNYIGACAMLLIIASMIWILAFQRRSADWLGVSFAVMGIVLLTLSFGEFSRLAPASLLARLPLFGRFRLPSRYTIVFVLAGVVAAAWTVRTLGQDLIVGLRLQAFVAIVCVLALADLVIHNRPVLGQAFSSDPMPARFHWFSGTGRLVTDTTTDWSNMYPALMNDRSIFNCYEPLQLARTADPQLPLISVDGPAKLDRITFTPNRVEFTAVGGTAPSRILLNQNYSAGWRSDAGPVVRDRASGLPYVTLASGQTGKFRFTFVPPGLIAGFVLMTVAVIASAGLSRFVRTGSSARETLV
jgi:hypothetical protein